MTTAPFGEVVSLARRALDKFIVDLTAARVEGKLNSDALTIAVTTLKPFYEGLPDDSKAEIVAEISKITGRDASWVARLFLLDDMDVSRALRCRPPKLDRHGEEKLYPSDGWLGAYLLYAQDSEAPLGWHFWCAVAVMGMVARRTFYWDRGRFIQYLNHYVLMIGDTGLKKTTSIEQTTDILKLASQLAIDSAVAGTADPFYFSSDRITPEALDADLSAWHKAHPDAKDTICAILNDEVATLLGKNVWGSDRLIHFITAVYGGKKVYRDASLGRGKREMHNLQVTCIFGSTADWIRDSVTNEMLTGGFLGRCVFVPRYAPHGIYPDPPPSDPIIRLALAEQLVPWISLSGLIRVQRSAEATEWFDEWYHEHKKKKPADERMLGWWNRKDDHLHKLAGILRLSELIGSGPEGLREVEDARTMIVGLRTFKQALKILDAEEDYMPKLVEQVGAVSAARHKKFILDTLNVEFKASRHPVQHSVVLRKTSHMIGAAWEFQRLMDSLIEEEMVELVSAGVGTSRRGRTYLPMWAKKEIDDAHTK